MDRRRVLVVDDDLVVGRFCRRVLEAASFEVLAAKNVGEAKQRLETEPVVDLVLSDMHMPDGTGLTLAGWIREHRPGCRVALMSGTLTADSTESIRAAGAVGLLAKPFTRDELLRFVNTHLS